MAFSQHQLRRAVTQLAIRQAIWASAKLSIGQQRSLVRCAIALSGSIPMLRRKVRENMRLALGEDPPAQAEKRYFDHLGWYYSSALPTFHHGVAATPVPNEVKFDETVEILDRAFAEGRGVVLGSAHWSGHELVGAVINLRHPVVMLVRQAPTAQRMARKLKWYGALGAETVLRPSQASTIKDAIAYLRVFKRGKLLGITPDLLANAREGVETSIFGRPARIHAGAFALAISAGAPMVRLSFRWRDDGGVTARFERAVLPADDGDRDAALRSAVQDWCRWFEERLRANPENWLFWLDKRWSHFLRTSPRIGGAV